MRKAYRVNKVKEGVYHVIGTGALTVVGNSPVIGSDDDVILVMTTYRRPRHECYLTN
jgi:hypothetical protein